jgi:exosome complex RNA-binding protein Rrp42 (RNase PH superfamily)
VCCNPKGRVCALKKGGNGSIEPSILNAMIQAAKPEGLKLIKDMESALEREELRVDRNMSLAIR